MPTCLLKCWFNAILPNYWKPLHTKLVPGAGLEPAWCRHRRILSPVRLPISPPGQAMVSRTRFELVTPWLKVKCSTNWANGSGWGTWDRTREMPESKSGALPLGYTPIEWWRKVDLNHRTRRSWFTVSRVWPLRYSSTKKGWLRNGGCWGAWTHDLRRVKAMLSQLS